MKYISKITVLSTLTVLCFFTGCAVSWKHQQESPFNLIEVKKVAIIESYLDKRSFHRKLVATGKFTIASEKEVQDWQRWNSEHENAMSKYYSEMAKYNSEKALFDSQAQAILISTAKLAGEYRQNELRADGSFNTKQLRVTGVVNGIEKDAQGEYFIRFAGAGNDSVLAFFVSSERSRIAALNRGKTITIIGTCIGRRVPYDDTEINRIMGTGRPINITNAAFTVSAPVEPVAPKLKDYKGPVDAVIYSWSANNKRYITYRIVHTRDGSNIGSGRVDQEVTGCIIPIPSREDLDKVLDIIVNQIVNAIQ